MNTIANLLRQEFSDRNQNILLYSTKLVKPAKFKNIFLCNELKECGIWLKKYFFDLVIFEPDTDEESKQFILFCRKQNPKRTLCCAFQDSFTDVLHYYQEGIDLFLPAGNINAVYLQCSIELLLKDYNRIIISKNPRLQKQYELLFFYANKIKTDVLMTGENGTGKGIIANAIHLLGNYKGELVTQNCAGIPDSLFESEMFGYVAGAFTGASQKGKIGVIEKAEKGILFLDEIGDLPLNQQAKLLRAIQRKMILPVGATKETSVDVRFLYATNKNLWQEMQNGTFRDDFYYRLKGAEIDIPPLRQTKEDIEIMTAIFVVRFFAEQFHTHEIPLFHLDTSSFENLKQYSFPGNMRELQKIVYQSLIEMTAFGKKQLEFRLTQQNPAFPDFESENVESIWQILTLLEQNLIKYGGVADCLKKMVVNHLRTKYQDDRNKIASVLGFQDKQSLANEIYRLNKRK
jgi:transcriptional regulator with PAS, ATPase and Fis domain